MKKNTKILLGVALLAVAGYFLYEKSQKDKVLDAAKTKSTGFAGTPCGTCGGVVGNRQ